MKLWVTVGHSESGNDYLHLFQNEPSDERLSELVHGWDGDEQKDGPGYDGSYVHLTVKEFEVEDN
jgi:hypothetical protein